MDVSSGLGYCHPFLNATSCSLSGPGDAVRTTKTKFSGSCTMTGSERVEVAPVSGGPGRTHREKAFGKSVARNSCQGLC